VRLIFWPRPQVLTDRPTATTAKNEALALKAPSLMKKINTMTLRNRPMSDRRLQRVTVCVSDIGQGGCDCCLINEGGGGHAIQPSLASLLRFEIQGIAFAA
jgi:hypothetical protein